MKMEAAFGALALLAFAAPTACETRLLDVGVDAGGGGVGTGGADPVATGVGGTAGVAGGCAGGMAGSVAPPVDVMAAFDGQKLLMRCGATSSYTELTCTTRASTCHTSPPDNLTQGVVFRDDTVTIDGAPGTIYDVTLRIRGVVEPRHYENGVFERPTSGADTYGWYVGGAPVNAGSYGIYMIWVSSPVVVPTSARDGQFYFLNALTRSEAHFAYPLDYTVTLPVAAGAQVRFLADDANSSIVKNCDTTSTDGFPGTPAAQCNPITIADLPDSAGITQPYLGQFIYLSVVSVTAE